MRGLKFKNETKIEEITLVAPHAGAWIEIRISAARFLLVDVAPHAGAWIEIEFRGASLLLIGRRTPRGCVD